MVQTSQVPVGSAVWLTAKRTEPVFVPSQAEGQAMMVEYHRPACWSHTTFGSDTKVRPVLKNDCRPTDFTRVPDRE